MKPKRIFNQLLILSLILLIPLSAQAIDSRVSVLDNGLKVIIVEDHRSPVATFQIWYRVGSVDDPLGNHGLAHLLEHMLFKGTKEYPKGEFSRIIAQYGGEENAGTLPEATFCYGKLPSEHLELAFRLEADRMKNLLLKQEEVALELEVVKEERRMRIEDDPTSVVMEELKAIAFKVHPYHYPTIGFMTELNTITYEDLRQYYEKYFIPNNAIIVVVGDINPLEIMPRIRKYFESIPVGPLPVRRNIIEPKQQGERRVTVQRPAQLPFVALGYHVPNLTHPDAYPLEVLENILLGGKSSRLYQDLVYKKAIALYVGGYYNRVAGSADLFRFYAELQPGKTTQEFESVLYTQLDEIKNTPVTDQELQKAKNQISASFIFAQDSIFYQAMQIGQLEAIGVDHNYLNQFVSNIRAVTKQDIQRVAKEYFGAKNRSVAILVPEKGGGTAPKMLPQH